MWSGIRRGDIRECFQFGVGWSDQGSGTDDFDRFVNILDGSATNLES